MENPIDPDEELATFLRQGAGRDIAEDAAEDETLTEALRERRLGLAEVAEDAAHRGNRATADNGATVVSGQILAVGTDYLTMALPEQEADIRFDEAVWSFVEAQGEVRSAGRSGMSFLGRLKEYSANGTRVRLELTTGSPLMGVIKTVAQDHVRVDDPDRRIAYVPITMVRAVIRSTSQH